MRQVEVWTMSDFFGFKVFFTPPSFFFFFWCYIAVNSFGVFLSSHLLQITQNSCKWLDIRCGICFKITVKKTHNNFYSTIILYRLPWWLSGKESTHQFRRLRFNPWVRNIPQWRKQQPTYSILAWEIPRTEEPGGLQSMGSPRGGDDRATKQK